MHDMPNVDQLPNRPAMPDVMTLDNGRKVKTLKQWNERRTEMMRTLEYYAVGQAPPPPGNVKGVEVSSQMLMDGKVKYRLVHLTFGPNESLSLDIGIFTPATGGPFPTLVSPSGTPPGATPLPHLAQGANQGRKVAGQTGGGARARHEFGAIGGGSNGRPVRKTAVLLCPSHAGIGGGEDLAALHGGGQFRSICRRSDGGPGAGAVPRRPACADASGKVSRQNRLIDILRDNPACSADARHAEGVADAG